MASEQEPGKFGAFGKIPSLGDFFRLSMPQGFVEPWDAFLQAALVAGRAVHAESWTEYYMMAPIWRFALAPGVAGSDPMLGVVMPSVDRVGRQFPLTLAAQMPSGMPLRQLIQQDMVLTALEDIALDSLEDSMTRDALAARLSAVQALPAGGEAKLRATTGGHVLTSGQTAHLGLDLALAQASPAAAVFFASVEGASRLMSLAALPQGEAAAALFDLDASFWGEERG